jgi:transcriptional regulator with XRE-family HTH domain
LSQAVFAKEIGVGLATVKRFEAGDIPSKKVLLLWSIGTGVPPEWLLDGEPDSLIQTSPGLVPRL